MLPLHHRGLKMNVFETCVEMENGRHKCHPFAIEGIHRLLYANLVT